MDALGVVEWLFHTPLHRGHSDYDDEDDQLPGPRAFQCPDRRKCMRFLRTRRRLLLMLGGAILCVIAFVPRLYDGHGDDLYDDEEGDKLSARGSGHRLMRGAVVCLLVWGMPRRRVRASERTPDSLFACRYAAGHERLCQLGQNRQHPPGSAHVRFSNDRTQYAVGSIVLARVGPYVVAVVFGMKKRG
jgi:hypothetical protein